MINCKGELNGREVAVHLATPLIKSGDEIYFENLRIEIAGVGILRIPLGKLEAVLSSRYRLAPAASKSKIKSIDSSTRGKLRLIKTRD